MSSPRSFVTPLFAAALVAIVVAGPLAGARAAIAQPLPSAYASGAPTDATRFCYAGVPAYAEPCAEEPYRRDDAYVFAATRSLRESGIHPVVAVVLAPATLAVDTLFSPFAVALESLARSR
jgi:hypothetical protein